MDKDKEEIIKLFRDNIKGKKPELLSGNKKHNGKEGHWLETQMDIPHNSKMELIIKFALEINFIIIHLLMVLKKK